MKSIASTPASAPSVLKPTLVYKIPKTLKMCELLLVLLALSYMGSAAYFMFFT